MGIPEHSNPDLHLDVPSSPPASEHGVKLQDAAEREPELHLAVAGPCKNPAGKYVGLSKSQRTALGVVEGATVELFQDEKSLGLYTVGGGSKELLDRPQLFTVNGVNSGVALTIKRSSAQRETLLSYPVSRIDVAGSGEKILRRRAIIQERYPASDPDEYVTVPTAVMNQLSGASVRVASISRGVIRFAGKDVPITLVPTGMDVGLTDKAAQKLGIPEGLSEIRIRIDNGVLVID